MYFEAESDAGLRTHCGVQEFTAPEGNVYCPFWVRSARTDARPRSPRTPSPPLRQMMEQLGVEEGAQIALTYVRALPPGTFIKLQAQSVDFLDISNPRAVLEYELRDYVCLSEGDVFAFDYNGKVYRLRVVECRPAQTIATTNTDLVLEFDAPVGYVEPVAASSSAVTASAAAAASSSSAVARPSSLPAGLSVSGLPVGDALVDAGRSPAPSPQRPPAVSAVSATAGVGDALAAQPARRMPTTGGYRIDGKPLDAAPPVSIMTAPQPLQARHAQQQQQQPPTLKRCVRTADRGRCADRAAGTTRAARTTSMVAPHARTNCVRSRPRRRPYQRRRPRCSKRMPRSRRATCWALRPRARRRARCTRRRRAVRASAACSCRARATSLRRRPVPRPSRTRPPTSSRSDSMAAATAFAEARVEWRRGGRGCRARRCALCDCMMQQGARCPQNRTVAPPPPPPLLTTKPPSARARPCAARSAAGTPRPSRARRAPACAPRRRPLFAARDGTAALRRARRELPHSRRSAQRQRQRTVERLHLRLGRARHQGLLRRERRVRHTAAKRRHCTTPAAVEVRCARGQTRAHVRVDVLEPEYTPPDGRPRMGDARLRWLAERPPPAGPPLTDDDAEVDEASARTSVLSALERTRCKRTSSRSFSIVALAALSSSCSWRILAVAVSAVAPLGDCAVRGRSTDTLRRAPPTTGERMRLAPGVAPPAPGAPLVFSACA